MAIVAVASTDDRLSPLDTRRTYGRHPSPDEIGTAIGTLIYTQHYFDKKKIKCVINIQYVSGMFIFII